MRTVSIRTLGDFASPEKLEQSSNPGSPDLSRQAMESGAENSNRVDIILKTGTWIMAVAELILLFRIASFL